MSKEEFGIAYPTRNALVTALADYRAISVVYVQNTADDHHFNGHFREFHSQNQGEWTPSFLTHEQLVLFEDQRGHDTAEPRAMMPDLARAAIALQRRRFG